MDLIHLRLLKMKKNKCKKCGQNLPDRKGLVDFTSFMDKTIKKVFRRMDEEFGVNVKKTSKDKNKRS